MAFIKFSYTGEDELPTIINTDHIIAIEVKKIKSDDYDDDDCDKWYIELTTKEIEHGWNGDVPVYYNKTRHCECEDKKDAIKCVEEIMKKCNH